MNILLCGKSGSGKDFARNFIIENYGFTPIISHTSRPIREGEINGKDYYFISDYEFIEKDLHNDFIETRSYSTTFEGKAQIWHYGTSYLEMQKDLSIGIKDLVGARLLKHYGKNVVVIYIHSDDNIRETRAKLRGSYCEQEWNRRLKADEQDFEYIDLVRTCDYFINNNGDEAEFKEELDKVIQIILEEN